MPRRAGAGGFEEEPGPPLGLVDPGFNQARGADIVVFLAEAVNFSQSGGEASIILAQFRQHIERLHVVGVVVEDPLRAGDVADGTDRRGSEFADPFGDRIGHAQQLIGVFIQHQVVIAEMRSAEMPVKILGFEIQREHVGENGI